MSLTNYLTQSMVGSFIYFGYGLSLYDDLGTTASFAVGILLFILQLGFCHWWLAIINKVLSREYGVKLRGCFLDSFYLFTFVVTINNLSGYVVDSNR